MLGGLALKLVFKGGRWVYIAYQMRKATSTMRVIGTSVGDLHRLLNITQKSDDAFVTLYRGTTGSERAGNLIYLTDDIVAAGKYAANGGKVVSYKVSSSALYELQANRMLNILSDIHKPSGHAHKTFEFIGSNLREALNLNSKIVYMKYCCRAFGQLTSI